MNMQAPRHALNADASPSGAPPGDRPNLRVADWFYRSRAASVIWLIAWLWLGYGWLNAGYQKLWGSEPSAATGTTTVRRPLSILSAAHLPGHSLRISDIARKGNQ
jgi:hypothetical protein